MNQNLYSRIKNLYIKCNNKYCPQSILNNIKILFALADCWLLCKSNTDAHIIESKIIKLIFKTVPRMTITYNLDKDIILEFNRLVITVCKNIQTTSMSLNSLIDKFVELEFDDLNNLCNRLSFV